MELTHWRRALAAGALLALPASAQDAPIVITPPSGMTLVPDGAVYEGPVIEVPPPVVERPGLFGWRRKHAEKKRHWQEHVLGYPEEFNEWPLGQALYAHGRTQVANGQAARMILNEYDFVDNDTELNFRGKQKFDEIKAQLPSSFSPLIIEQTAWDPQRDKGRRVDEARRVAILNKLAEGPFPVPAERVVVGPAVPNGLRGKEAVKVDGLRQNLFYGAGGGAGGGAGSGTVSGFDASGLSGPVSPGGR